MTVKRALYLRIPVSAFTAESRALSSAGGSWPRSGHGIMTAKQELYLRIPVFCVRRGTGREILPETGAGV